jgi:hypothetical protein
MHRDTVVAVAFVVSTVHIMRFIRADLEYHFHITRHMKILWG